MKAALFLALGLTNFSQALEVHEWGTFTVLSGSNGFQVPWYTSLDELAKLPDFVSKPQFDKSGYAKIRMETPVIYFYPEKEMDVSVEVSFAEGRITETFPHSSGGLVFPAAMGMSGARGNWKGSLHRPTDKSALAEIPRIPESNNVEPYAAAREVPDAWIFASALDEIPGLQVQPQFPQVEKFIFYRGAGNGFIPLQTKLSAESVRLTNYSEGAVPFAVALRVRGEKAAWREFAPISRRPTDGRTAESQSVIAVPDRYRSLDEVESELAEVWKKALAADGLTSAEASAMVETWRTTWFRESGDRVLTLVPRDVTDRLLPLKITPSPEKTERVFVARIEMLAPEREEILMNLLSSPVAVVEADLVKFRDLELGRFGTGAVEVVGQLQRGRMSGKYFDLKRLEDEPKGLNY